MARAVLVHAGRLAVLLNPELDNPLRVTTDDLLRLAADAGWDGVHTLAATEEAEVRVELARQPEKLMVHRAGVDELLEALVVVVGE
eukprot:13374513-Alexandrium_andersonii.AAC.1